MSEVKIMDLSEAPGENQGRLVEFDHPLTTFPYVLGVFHIKDRYFAITDACRSCGSTLAGGALNGMFASCVMEEHPWNVKTGICKYDRSLATPTYRVQVKEDGLYIEI